MKWKKKFVNAVIVADAINVYKLVSVILFIFLFYDCCSGMPVLLAH